MEYTDLLLEAEISTFSAACIFLQVIEPRSTMSDIAITSTSQSSFVIPKLCDDGSNWVDYEPRVKNAMGAKGLMKYAKGRAGQPTPLTIVDNVPMSRDDPTVAATEEQIESAEKKMDDYE